MKQTFIIGGGIVGLFAAYFLQKEGVEVTILDRTDLKVNCSTGNAGMIVPSHIIPLAAPGMITKGIGWMFSSKSPFYIHPRLDFKLAQWCYHFYKAANEKQVKRSIPFLKNLGFLSKALYREFNLDHPNADLGLVEKGLMMVYQTGAMEKEEIEFAQLARKHGLEAEVLTQADLKIVEPNLKLEARGAILFPGDAHLDPGALYAFLKKYLQEKGVKFLVNTEVLGFEKSQGKVEKIRTDQGDYEVDKVLLCGGSWTGALAKMLGFSMPMMGGKGYSFLQKNSPEIRQATILTEKKVAVSPYGTEVRFGGTMEIAGTDQTINLKRVRGIFESIQQYYPDFEAKFPEKEQIWQGLRPCSPDGLPYLGLAPGYENVLVGSGHAMMGISLAPATGKILAELHQQKVTKMGIEGFEVGRFG